jgi:hypothetical protein
MSEYRWIYFILANIGSAYFVFISVPILRGGVNQYEHVLPFSITIYKIQLYYENITIRITIQQYHIRYTIHQNLHGNPNERKQHNAFLYIYQEYIHRNHQFPNSPTPTRRRHQPPYL